jgi:short-subunit dehydrogenase
VITGCSSGIGYDAAATLHARGYDVIASCRQQKDVDRLISEGFNSQLLDLTSDDSINAFVSALKQQNKQVYGLINNGAFGVPGAVEDLNREALLTQFQTNVFGTHQLTAAIIPIMRSNNSGRIIQISSILGALCLRFRGAYNASKYALEALSDTMRLELAGTDIKISLVQPGPVETQFRDNALLMYRRFIDIENSVHKIHYQAVESRLESDEPVRFTLPPSSVTKHIIHALESTHPKTRYRVTVPTRIFLPLKRLLPDKWMDALLLKIG